MIQTKIKRQKGSCEDCGKEIELRGCRKRCSKCGIKEQHKQTNMYNEKKKQERKEKSLVK